MLKPMNTAHLQIQATRFRAMHQGPILLLPNAWDGGSARAIEQAGAKAIATTSAGVSWALGLKDAQRLSRERMLEAVAQIVQAVDLPVTADLEGGYGAEPSAVAQTVHGLLQAGAVGLNLEDSGNGGEPLLATQTQALRLQAARAAAGEADVEVFINARTDVFFFPQGRSQEALIAEAIERGNAYLEAGADCVFVPGVLDPAVIAALLVGLRGPLNTQAIPGAPSIAELERLGVARASLGSAIAEAAYQLTCRIALEALEQGTYTLASEHAGLRGFAAVNAMMKG